METQEKSKLALTVYKPNGLSLREIDYLGQIMAASGRFADVGDKSKAIVQILAGQEMGFSPLVSITKIYVIKGKISLSAELIASMIKRSGEYDYEVTEHTNKKCSIQFYRNGKKGYLSVFTIEDAKQAAVSFLNNFDFDLREFAIEKVETRTLRIDGNRLTETPALVNANLVEVNFKRLDIDKIPVITPQESSASAKALLGS